MGGEKWLDATLPLQVMAICGLIRSFTIADPIFASENTPQYSSYTLLLSLSLMFCFLYYSIVWKGLIGAACCITVIFLFHYIFSHYFLNKILIIQIQEIFNEMVKPFFATIFMLLVLYIMSNKIESLIDNKVSSLIVIILLGMFSYFSIIYFTLKNEIISKLSN